MALLLVLFLLASLTLRLIFFYGSPLQLEVGAFNENHGFQTAIIILFW